ncbi:outer membrane beta-barrel protein [bacterium]|nr:outer membrane beta-barrel protein [bacterium]
MKKALITIFFIFFICLSITTYAQDLDKKYEIGVSAGYYLGAAEEDGMQRIRDEREKSYEKLIGEYITNLGDAPIFYLNGAYRFKDYGFFRLQVGYSEFKIELDRHLYHYPDDDIVGKLNTIPIAINFNYFLMRKSPFKPYITAGFTSYVFFDSQDISTSPTVRLGADFGTGIEYYLDDMIAVNFDLGYHFLKMEVDADEPFNKRGYPQTFEEVNAIPDRVEASIGLKFLIY